MCLSINTFIWKSTLIVELSESWSLTFLLYRSPNLSKRRPLGLKSPALHKSWQHCQWPQWYRNISTFVIWMDKDGSSKSIYNPNISMDLIWMMIIDDDQVYKQLSEKNDTIIRNVLDIEASKASWGSRQLIVKGPILFRYEQQELYFLTFLTVEHSKIRKMPEVFFGTPENVPNYFAKKYF